MGERILLYTWAAEDIEKAKVLAQVQKIADIAPENLLCEHYRRTAETLFKLQAQVGERLGRTYE